MLKFGGIAAVEAPMDLSAVSQYRSVTLFPLLASSLLFNRQPTNESSCPAGA